MTKDEFIVEDELKETPKRKRKTTNSSTTSTSANQAEAVDEVIVKTPKTTKKKVVKEEVNLFTVDNNETKVEKAVELEEEAKPVSTSVVSENNEKSIKSSPIEVKNVEPVKEDIVATKTTEPPKKEVKKEEHLPSSVEKFIAKSQHSKAKKQRKLEKKQMKNNQTLMRYNANPDEGLTQEQVEKRISQGLVNVTKKGSTKSIKKIIFSNLITFFNILTFAIAGILISVRAFTDLFFVVIVTANIVIGIIQEIKAKNIIDRLSLMQAPTAFVIRDGTRSEIAVSEVVLDDILVLEAGKQIPSDAILIDGSVEVNESLLTGESDAIIKKPGDTLYSGSFVISGTCHARVDKVGKDNYISRLSGEAKLYKKPKSDLLKSLNYIIVVMAVIIIPIGVTLFYMQHFVNGVDMVTAVRKTAGAMVGMIPSGLMLLSSVALAVGVIRLAQNKVMVQELYCIEMLARVNVLCLDKTGTITDGTMSVKDVVEYENNFGISTKVVINGMLNALKENNLTQKALEDKFGSNKKIKYHSLIHFSSQRKFNAVSFERYGTFIMGAPEFVLRDVFENYRVDVDNYSKQGYRVLALAHKEGFIENETLPEGPVQLVSLILIEDNIRPDAIETITYFKNSGVEVKVISGDNPLTVAKISERAGIDNAKVCVSLDGMSDEDVARAATRYTVFGRVSPDQKRILVKALKEAGKTVAMTGDGVNDILALREADCSIAMASGSEAARNASHLVLIDSNFSSMPKVVAEGRRVINNVARVACLFLTKTIFSFLLAMQALNSGGIYPISTVQLSIIDFFVVGIPAFFLVLEPNNNEVDSRFLPNIIKGALPGAITILICSMITFQLVDYLNYDFMTSSTIIIVVATNTCLMVLFKVCHPYNRLRKLICGCSYTLFVLCIIFLPSLFEIRPIFKFMEYTSDTVEITRLDSIPSIAISEDYNFVLDGVVYDTKAYPGMDSLPTTSSSNGELTINSGQNFQPVTLNGEGWKIPTPTLSVDENNVLYAGGYNTGVVKFSDSVNNIHLKYDENGNVYIYSLIEDNQEKEILATDYSILPSFSINNNYLYLNGTKTDVLVNYSKINTVTLDSNTMLVSINGSTEIGTVNGEPYQYKVEEANITYDSEDNLILDASKIIVNNNSDEQVEVTIATFVLDSLKALVEHEENADSYSQQYIRADGVIYAIYDASTGRYLKSNISIIQPSIEIAEAGRYIIDGKYTKYVATSNGGDSATQVNVTEDGYLTINDLVTDYKADFSIQTGGIVQRLSIPAILILVTLCLASAPLMRVLTGFVPWLKQTIKSIQNVLSKF